MIPFAYITGIYQIITSNPFQDRKVRRNKALVLIIFLLAGLPFLAIAQFPNAWFCLKSLYFPKQNIDALANEKEQEVPVNTRNFQRMYQVVSKEVLE